MPWISARITRNTNRDSIVAVSVTFTDEAEFVDPFTFTVERLDSTSNPQIVAFRNAANAALDAERSRRATLAAREAQLLAFMNP